MLTEFPRLLNLAKLTQQKSVFLFGPRGTGKSTLIQRSLPDAQTYDLLDERTYLKLLSNSAILEQENPGKNKLIVIDEIQKLPKILDEVQRLIFRNQHRFLLTGSSARKIKRSGANLLGGRAREAHFYPLTSAEIPSFDLLTYLNRGGLPAVFQSDEPLEDLKSYVSLYLREEIGAEALTRRVDFFSRFLETLALNNGEELHYQNLSSDTGIQAKTIKNYVEILEDTLLGFHLHPYEATKKRKAIARSKFYFFDLGVVRMLSRRGELALGSELFGKAFEHFIILETRAALGYRRSDSPLQYWRTKTGFEVDLILGNESAIEIKGTAQITERHLKGLRALKEERKLKRFAIVSLVDRKRTLDGIEIYPFSNFLDELWSGLWF